MEQIMNWFYENYIEKNSEIDNIVNDTCVKTACSVKSLYQSCVVLKKVYPERNVLRTEAKCFGELANHGIRGDEAGKALITYGVVKSILI